tara:strand:+ start:111 stop:227 length:117 start_codon:yes stop_codon:yes gene_type:complete
VVELVVVMVVTVAEELVDLENPLEQQQDVIVFLLMVLV